MVDVKRFGAMEKDGRQLFIYSCKCFEREPLWEVRNSDKRYLEDGALEFLPIRAFRVGRFYAASNSCKTISDFVTR